MPPASNLRLISIALVLAPLCSIWDVRSGGVVRTLESQGAVTSLEVTDGGRHIVTADAGGVDFRDGATFELAKRHVVQGYQAESASFCPERRRFVAGGSDMWVRLYDYDTGAELEAGRGHHGPVHCVRFAPGGATYASGSEDGTIRLWQTEVASGGAGENGAAPHAPVAPPTAAA